MKTFSKLATIICAIALLSAIETPAQVNIQPYVNKVNPDAPARKTRTGMIIVGKPDTVRVFSAYSGGASSGVRYAETANKLQAALGDGVQVYCMPIPSAAEFYTPEAATAWTHSQLPTISKIFDTLDKRVNCQPEFRKHYGTAHFTLFEGEHFLNGQVLSHVVLPLVEEILVHSSNS